MANTINVSPNEYIDINTNVNGQRRILYLVFYNET